MTKSLYDRGLLRPADIAKLKRVFDQACSTRHVVPDSEGGKELALTLLALHNAGMVDEDLLTAAVAFQPPERKRA